MGKNRTNTSKYKSRYGGGYITAAQHITEILCELVAKQDGDNLYDKFWNDKKWGKLYRSQIPFANYLLSKYPLEVIIKSIYDRDVANKIRSFRAKWLLEPVLEKNMKEYKVSLQNKEIRKKVEINEKPRKPFGGLSGLSMAEQLKRLESG